jgi:hypothetical protein
MTWKGWWVVGEHNGEGGMDSQEEAAFLAAMRGPYLASAGGQSDGDREAALPVRC